MNSDTLKSRVVVSYQHGRDDTGLKITRRMDEDLKELLYVAYCLGQADVKDNIDRDEDDVVRMSMSWRAARWHNERSWRKTAQEAYRFAVTGFVGCAEMAIELLLSRVEHSKRAKCAVELAKGDAEQGFERDGDAVVDHIIKAMGDV